MGSVFLLFCSQAYIKYRDARFDETYLIRNFRSQDTDLVSLISSIYFILLAYSKWTNSNQIWPCPKWTVSKKRDTQQPYFFNFKHMVAKSFLHFTCQRSTAWISVQHSNQKRRRKRRNTDRPATEIDKFRDNYF